MIDDGLDVCTHAHLMLGFLKNMIIRSNCIMDWILIYVDRLMGFLGLEWKGFTLILAGFQARVWKWVFTHFHCIYIIVFYFRSVPGRLAT